MAIAEELRATGTIIVLEGEGSTFPLKVDSLSSYTRERKGVRKTKWLLLSVRDAHGNEPERATVWVSDAYRQQFLKLFEDYLDDEKNTEAGYPKNRALVANISRIRSAVLEDLWTSESDPPQSGMHWWELWLDGPSDRVGDLKAFLAACRLQARCGEFRLGDRLIVWVQATWQQLQRLPFTSVPLVEIRRPTFIDTIETSPLMNKPNTFRNLRHESRLQPTRLLLCAFSIREYYERISFLNIPSLPRIITRFSAVRETMYALVDMGRRWLDSRFMEILNRCWSEMNVLCYDTVSSLCA